MGLHSKSWLLASPTNRVEVTIIDRHTSLIRQAIEQDVLNNNAGKQLS
jgi:hypothetical protein